MGRGFRDNKAKGRKKALEVKTAPGIIGTGLARFVSDPQTRKSINYGWVDHADPQVCSRGLVIGEFTNLRYQKIHEATLSPAAADSFIRWLQLILNKGPYASVLNWHCPNNKYIFGGISSEDNILVNIFKPGPPKKRVESRKFIANEFLEQIVKDHLAVTVDKIDISQLPDRSWDALENQAKRILLARKEDNPSSLAEILHTPRSAAI